MIYSVLTSYALILLIISVNCLSCSFYYGYLSYSFSIVDVALTFDWVKGTIGVGSYFYLGFLVSQ